MARRVVVKKSSSKELVPTSPLKDSGALVHVSKAPSSSQVELLEQLGLTGLKRSYGVVFEEFLPDLQGQNAIRIYREMRDNEAIIGGMFFAIEMFMRKVKWFVDPAGDDDKAKEDAQFLEENMGDMSHTWADLISEVMSMMQYGWSYFEIVYKKRDSNDLNEDGEPRSQFDDGKLGWRKIEIRSQDTLDRWRFDQDGGISGMWQYAPPNYDHVFLPIQKCLLFRTETKKNNPEGRSVLRNAYRSWYFKKRMEEVEGVGVERDLAGLPFAEVPAEMMSPDASDEDKATLKSIVDLVKNIRRDEQEGVVWPQSWDANGNPQYKFSLLNSGGTRQFPTDTIITRYEARMALTILADFILLGTESQGSFALSTTKSGMFQAALGAWLGMIRDVFNDYAIPRLFRANGIKGPYPKIRHEEVQQVPLADLATFLSALAGAGAQLFPDTELENHIRTLAQLPIREEEDSYRDQEQEVREAELEQQKEMARAQIKQAKQGIMPGQAQQGQAGERKVPGAPTKSTGPTKSKLPPQSRRRTKAVNAAENVKKRHKQPPGYVRETIRIRSNKEKLENQRPHKFKPAEWTHPNGHPRCIRCGGEERTGGICRPISKHASHRQKSHGNWARADIVDKIKEYMGDRYPDSVLKWVDEAEWEGPKTVKLSRINMARRPGGRDPKKVQGIAEKVRSGAKMDPIVLVDTGEGKMTIADGFHRTLGFKHAGRKELQAFIGHAPGMDVSQWHRKLHDSKLNKRLIEKYVNGEPGCNIVEDYIGSVSKHYRGLHNQKSHGNWARKLGDLAELVGAAIDTDLVLDMTGGSAENHLVKGKDGKFRFTPERQRLHASIIEGTLKRGKPHSTPRYNVMGGGPASGKSSMEKKNPDIGKDAAIINPDDVKAELPEYDEMILQGKGNAAAFTHEESSYVSKMAQKAAFNRRLNVTLDGTGDASVEKMRKKLAEARNAGYEVNAYYVTVDTEEAVRRAEKRAERTGRHVPTTVIRNTHKNVSIVLPEILDEFDNVLLYDNNGSEPVTVLSKKKGEKPEIHDQELWQRFVAKAG